MILTAADMGGKLKRFRLEAGLTQEKLAEVLGISASDISKIENGHKVPDAVTYEQWLTVCSTRPKEFVFYYGKKLRSGRFEIQDGCNG